MFWGLTVGNITSLLIGLFFFLVGVTVEILAAKMLQGIGRGGKTAYNAAGCGA